MSETINVLPKGYRLTKDNRELIAKAAIKRKFSKRINTIYNQEIEALNCLSEFLTGDAEKRKAYESAAKALAPGGKVDLWDTSVSIIIKEFSDNIGRSWKHIISTGFLMDLAKYAESNLNTHEGYFYIRTVRAVRASEGISLKDLPSKLRKGLEKLRADGKILREEVQKFKNKLDSVLSNYKSPSKLIEDAPEFIGLIRESLGLDPDPGRCSDIPKADDLQEVRKML